jgi:hypothetical protein
MKRFEVHIFLLPTLLIDDFVVEGFKLKEASQYLSLFKKSSKSTIV